MIVEHLQSFTGLGNETKHLSLIEYIAWMLESFASKFKYQWFYQMDARAESLLQFGRITEQFSIYKPCFGKLMPSSVVTSF